MITRHLGRHKHQLGILLSLTLVSGLCTAMVVARVVYTGSLNHVFLVWNLILAWIPLLCAFAASGLYARKSAMSRTAALLCAGLWLIFLPNALYVITDLIHLRPTEGVPIWFDLGLLFSFAWTSLFLGFVSLYLMQNLVGRAAGSLAGWLFVLVTLGLSGFGIYLGRFLGWNSWDIFFSPWSLMADIWSRLRHPLAHYGTFAFSLLYSVFFVSAYLILFSFARLQQATREVK